MRIRDPLKKIVSLPELLGLLETLKKEKLRIVTTNGCFDLLHWGHIQYLWQARKLGDRLVVLVNTDKSVQSLKGSDRPIQNEQARLRQLAGLESVDFVCLFSEPTPEQALSQIRPNTHCKGGDYRPDDLPESAVIRKNGGEVKCLSLEPGFSTTNLIERILKSESHKE